MTYRVVLVGALMVGAARSSEPPAVAPLPREAPPVYCPKNQPPPGGAKSWAYWGRVTAVDQFSITLRLTEGEVKQFQIDPSLIGPPPANQLWVGYRLPDVRVGDILFIDYVHRNGVDFCTQIDIYRRPGGKIPPLPSSFPEATAHVHERRQAYQDWEEQGIPIPEKFRPVHPGELAVPFPPEAPMPRPASPRPKA